MAKGNDIEERLVEFAVRIIALTSSLPNTNAGNHIGRQLMRSGTSPAPNYAEAWSAESNKDFVQRLCICLKELNESRIWLQNIARSGLIPSTRLTDILSECDELCRIIAASIRTTQSRH